jgi:NAD(P)-dependent dehydrogenase (short-subunit alcohol dehydrogenase family)
MSEVVVITGASAGVGRATALAFAAEGAKIGLIARGADGLEATRREVVAAGGEALAIQADVADADAVEDAAAQVEAAFGPIDTWINNAMTAVLGMVKDTPAEEFRRVMEVVYLGYVHGTLAALRRMQPRDRGTIVQVGSALAYRGIPLQASYCAGKHAIKGFTESLRAELIHDESAVKVTMVELPGLNTPQFGWVRVRIAKHPRPVPPVYQPEIAATAIRWSAAHPERRELMVGYPTVMTIWGNKLLPGIADRYLGRTNVEAQQRDDDVDPDRRDYLEEPVPGDQGAHGAFDAEATGRSLHLAFTTNRGAILAGTAAVGSALAAVLTRSRAS